MARKRESSETVPTFDDGQGFTVKATDGKDAGSKVRRWAEEFRYSSGTADDSEAATQTYLEAYETAREMDLYNGLAVSQVFDRAENEDDGA